MARPGDHEHGCDAGADPRARRQATSSLNAAGRAKRPGRPRLHGGFQREVPLVEPGFSPTRKGPACPLRQGVAARPSPARNSGPKGRDAARAAPERPEQTREAEGSSPERTPREPAKPARATQGASRGARFLTFDRMAVRCSACRRVWWSKPATRVLGHAALEVGQSAVVPRELVDFGLRGECHAASNVVAQGVAAGMCRRVWSESS